MTETRGAAVARRQLDHLPPDRGADSREDHLRDAHAINCVWNGERILPEQWAKYVATPSPANPAYGAEFWVYGGRDGLPADAYSPNGAAGQYAMIVPSKGVIVVRRGIDRGPGFTITKFSADVIAAMGL